MSNQPPPSGQQPDSNEPPPPDGDNDSGPIDLEPPSPEPPRDSKRRAEINAPGLIDDFDEDADFDDDPEVERVVRGIPVGSSAKASEERGSSVFKPTGEALCASTAWKTPGIIGVIITLVAAVLAGVYAAHTEWAYVLITIYNAALHTATGLGALVLSAFLLGRRVGSFEGATARMLLAVSLYLAVYSLKIPLIPGKFEEVVLAAGAYFGGLVVAFRVAPKDAVVIGAAHFGVAMALVLGGMLQGVIVAGGAAGAAG